MAGDDISMESSELKRRKMDRDDGRDVISNLPDLVQLHILSFLPTRDAVRTVMIPRFRYLWTSTRHLSFDHCAYHDCKEDAGAICINERFVNFTDHVLTLHENPTIDSLRLNLNYAAEVCPDNDDPRWEDGTTEETRSSNKIGTWIRFAVRRKVKFLDLNFFGCARELGFPDNLYVLPSVVLRCSCLVELKLASLELANTSRILVFHIEHAHVSLGKSKYEPTTFDPCAQNVGGPTAQTTSGAFGLVF